MSKYCHVHLFTKGLAPSRDTPPQSCRHVTVESRDVTSAILAGLSEFAAMDDKK